ncbi:MAG TPA: hypothetical protein VF908_04675, partial [Gemmatimonadaceae bacterium]
RRPPRWQRERRPSFSPQYQRDAERDFEDSADDAEWPHTAEPFRSEPEWAAPSPTRGKAPASSRKPTDVD